MARPVKYFYRAWSRQVASGVVALYLCASFVTSAVASDCITGPDNQMTISSCFPQLFNRADIELNETYQTVLLRLSEGARQQPGLAATRESLIRAQRAWVAFRDQDCAAVATTVAGDPAIESRNTMCLVTRTEQRVTELQKWASLLTVAPRRVVTTVDSSKPIAGQPLAHWLQAYWHWARSFAPDKQPSIDSTGSLCGVRQNQPVFFLSGSDDSRPTERRCSVPRNQHVLIPVLISLAQNIYLRQDVCPNLEALVREANRSAERLIVNVDDAPLPASAVQLAESGCFALEDAVHGVHGTAAGGGYWVVLAPMESGQHTVHFSGLYTHDGFSQDVRYELYVE